MVALSPRALRLTEAAIDRHAPSADRERWLSWKETRPGIREDEQRDIGEPSALPEDVAGLILAALRIWKARLVGELEECPAWDEFKISELDNQITYLESVASLIESVPWKRRRDGWRTRILGSG
jgi:hypothetical protein